MLEELITEDVIRVKESCTNWEEAIHVGVQLLTLKGFVEERYEKAIIDRLKEYGAYMAVSPNIVLSHGRPSDGVNEAGISLITLKEPINFGSEANDPIKLIITIASLDNANHILILSELVPLLRDEKSLETIFNAENKDTILNVIRDVVSN